VTVEVTAGVTVEVAAGVTVEYTRHAGR